MTQTIQNGDFNLFSDIARIQTRCPPEYITDEMICLQARRNRLPAGEPVIVQCMDHDGTELLAQCQYVVTRRTPYLHTVEAAIDQPRTTEEFRYEVAQVSEWIRFDGLCMTETSESEAVDTSVKKPGRPRKEAVEA